jgi:AAA domain, putative AbiEii toxin, Type IV TA system
MFHDTFGGFLVIDPTVGGMLSFRISDRPPTKHSEERGLDDTAIAFHTSALPLSQFGDGVRAFIGILSQIVGSDAKVVLIDEPEAFLHPPQARRLGNYLAHLANERKGSAIIATHSPEFVMGCLEIGAHKTTVVRLTYSAGVATARMLASDDLVPMFRDPLLRSTGVLNALFHKSAVVTEADADRAFYEEINRRLNDQNRGIQDGVFLNAVGKQTIHRLVRPLRKVGIPAAAIVDLDFLQISNKSEWPELLSACGIAPADINRLDKERDLVVACFKGLPDSKDGRPALKASGLDALGLADRKRAELLLSELARYGLFLVNKGELESWLGILGISGKKLEWLVKVFERLGSDSAHTHYVQASADDAWSFVESVSKWTGDPNRLGMD